MTDIAIEARVMRSLSGHFYARAILRGCQLTPLNQTGSVINSSRYDLSLAGRAILKPYTILTYLTATGVFAEVEWPDFWILQAIPGAKPAEIGFHPNWPFGIKGPLEILAQASGEESVDKLQYWWTDWAPKNGGQNEVIARWLGIQIKKRSPEINPDVYPHLIYDLELKNPPFLPNEAWKFDLQK